MNRLACQALPLRYREVCVQMPYFRHLQSLFCLAVLTLSVCTQRAVHAAPDPLRYQGGLRNSYDQNPLSPKQLDALLKSLRHKTGFLEMRFNEHGFLTIDNPFNVSGGSATARALLRAAIEMKDSIELQCRNRSSEVAFARLAKPVIFLSQATKKQIDVYPIEIDFSDFEHLRGDKRVLAAFDLGFVVLHELAHAALGLRDAAVESDSPGECEEHINRIRRELQLPERQNYFARVYGSPQPTAPRSSRQAELVFAQPVEQKGKVKLATMSLNWEAERVGPIRNEVMKLPAANRAQTASAP